ncbi:hypothetical protein SAMN02745673_04469 [Marinactinospora thermotolerans DSM 45154]|uniref:Uncharacterized protein n=1 Tax=Marinactinospora thermotolerans DSM 45154 TaxID=1122192 RepID=A0A1T4T4H6_9ACTN|nr:hypothetical protein [Marinactinospora thermotolerans]SKA35336.1 hypothetical protein SAMN02745673_04469 [Marinactinospora thermotolerans DSM 45154]
MQNIDRGMPVSSVPLGVKGSRPERSPSWNPHTSAPNITGRLGRLSTVAFTGDRTLPVSRNSSTSVVTDISPSMSGTRSITTSR